MKERKSQRYPQLKVRDLSESEKSQIRASIAKGEGDVYKLAKEFSCSPSQIAGVKAALNK